MDVMKARRMMDSEIEQGEKQQEFVYGEGVASDADSSSSIDAATEAADVMVAKSAVLVEMMEDLEERLRSRMANMSDPAPVYSRKVRRFQAMNRGDSDSSTSLPDSRSDNGLQDFAEAPSDRADL
jgi:chlorite dismutase